MSDSVQSPKFRVFPALRRFGRVLLRHSLPGLVFVVAAHVAMVVLAFGLFVLTHWDLVMNERGEDPPQWLASSMVFGAVLLAASVAPPLAAHAADCDQEGRPTRFREAWSVLWRQTPLTLVVQVIQTAIVALGAILLVIPGIIASVVVSLAVPARVIEGVGPLKAISRSVDLTEKVRWRLFGYQLLTGALAPLLLVGALVTLGANGDAIGELDTESPTYMIVNFTIVFGMFCVSSLMAWLSGLAPAVAYAEIRASGSARAVSDIFD